MAELRSLFDKKVRENAGAQTNARYQFQAHVAMLKICDLHEGDRSYQVVLDHFDDVVVVTHSDTGIVLDFIQVKSKASGSWTIAALTSAKKDADPPASIVGKMYANAAVFGSATGSLSFLSNAGFSVKGADGKPFPPEVSRISAAALHESEQTRIEAALDPDFPPPREPNCSGILFLEKSPLDLTQQATFVTGRLVEMLGRVGEAEDLPVRALYETIFANVSAKSAASGTYENDTEFYATKAVSRGDIAKVLAKASATPRFRSWWPSLAAELAAEGYSTAKALALENACFSYMRRRAAGEFHTRRLSEAACNQLPPNLEADLEHKTVLGAATPVAQALGHLEANPVTALAAAIVEIMERTHGKPA
ncbi:MAG TPA: dsDNA nuclease domain-containing protein [Allosphingosinicella sp.]